MSYPSSDPNSTSNHQLYHNAPRGWLNCPSMGDVIDGIFLPIKTPLKDPMIQPDLKFDTQDFLDEVKRRGLKVGLIINLCNTQKYYDRNIFQSADLEYTRIPCRGNNVAPDPRDQGTFIYICNTFLDKNPGKIIAVHCTHGFNRTGFMICSYLCYKRNWSIESSVSHFASKREPGIYRQRLLDKLFKMFGSSGNEIVKAPPEPDWCS